jgi:hypothetical protein
VLVYIISEPWSGANAILTSQMSAAAMLLLKRVGS